MFFCVRGGFLYFSGKPAVVCRRTADGRPEHAAETEHVGKAASCGDRAYTVAGTRKLLPGFFDPCTEDIFMRRNAVFFYEQPAHIDLADACGGGNIVIAHVCIEHVLVQKQLGGTENSEAVVRSYEQVSAVRDLAVERFGRIDLLVNFAGGAETRILGASGEFPDIPIPVYDRGIDVNLKGQFYFDHAVMKQMREQKSGIIVNTGSITGEEGCTVNVAYSASKSGVMNGLTKSLALYGAKYGVRCVCLSPGPVLTRPGMAAMKTAVGRA